MKIKRLVAALSAVLCLASFAGLSASAAETKDKVYKFNYIEKGWVYFTETRPKTNTTGTYVSYLTGNTQPKGTYYSVWSAGENDTRNGAGIIYPGQKRKLAQFVYEKGKRDCYLGVSPNGYNSSEISGVWSPDSVGSYPYAN